MNSEWAYAIRRKRKYIKPGLRFAITAVVQSN